MDGLSGLASGVDTSSIVSQLVALDRQGATRLKLRQSAVQGEQTSIRAIAAKLAAVKAAAATVRAAATWKPQQSVSSSEPAKVSVTRTGGAGIGGHAIQVDRLAASAQRSFSFAGPAAAAGTLAFTAKDGTSVALDVAAGATAQQIADQVNARENVPVYAAVAGGQLVFSSRKTGDNGTFTVAGSLTGDGTLAETSNRLTNLNAQYRLDGEATAREAETNLVDDAVAGLRLSLKGITAAPVSVTVDAPALDREKVTGAIKGFVDAYNALVDSTRTHLQQKRIPTAANSAEAAQGQLFGDRGLESMLGGLKDTLRSVVGGLGGLDELADIGIAVPKATGGAASADAKAGKLVLDADKLATALNADWTQVQKLFAGSGAVGGFAKKVEEFVAKQTGGTGVLDARIENGDRQIKRLGSQLTSMDDRLAAKEKRLKAQFAAMEAALQSAQSQQSWLAGQISALR